MVERLKEAIEKARLAREAQAAGGGKARSAGTTALADPTPASGAAVATGADARLWEALPLIPSDAARLKSRRIVSVDKGHPASANFDILRTRLLKICRDNGWRRIAVTSPTKGCGKSLVALNLALSLTRSGDLRGALVELDLRAPSLAGTLGVKPEHMITDYLSGAKPMEACGVRIAPTLAVFPADRWSSGSAELLMSPDATGRIREMSTCLAPDMMIFDLSPLFVSDDAQAFLQQVDAVLLVAAGGQTTAAQIIECERLVENGSQFLGVVMNKSEDLDPESYQGAYAEYGAPQSGAGAAS